MVGVDLDALESGLPGSGHSESSAEHERDEHEPGDDEGRERRHEPADSQGVVGQTGQDRTCSAEAREHEPEPD